VRTVHIGMNPLQVGIPSPPGFVVGVADPVPDQNPFPADIATIGHSKTLLNSSRYPFYIQYEKKSRDTALPVQNQEKSQALL
jgi:hypothetical protein